MVNGRNAVSVLELPARLEVEELQTILTRVANDAVRRDLTLQGSRPEERYEDARLCEFLREL